MMTISAHFTSHHYRHYLDTRFQWTRVVTEYTGGNTCLFGFKCFLKGFSEITEIISMKKLKKKYYRYQVVPKKKNID